MAIFKLTEELIMENKTNQSIKGDKNVQQQVNTQVNNYYLTGVTKEEAESIAKTQAEQIATYYFEQSQNLAMQRMNEFSEKMMNVFIRCHQSLDVFSDPSFVYQFREAQLNAAQTGRENDYDLLTQLLLRRCQKRNIKYIQTGISGAIKIINEVSDDSLIALTILMCVMQITPLSTDVDVGLKTLDNLYESIIQNIKLPTDYSWFDQLDVLKAIRINTLSSFKKFDDLMLQKLAGYAEVGIEIDTPQYKEALQIENDFHFTLHKTNHFMSNYIVIPYSEEDYENITIQKSNNESFYLKQFVSKENYVSTLTKLRNLYVKDDVLEKKIKDEFIKKLNSYETISKVREWWNQLPHHCEITSIGKALAHAYAQNLVPDFPPLD